MPHSDTLTQTLTAGQWALANTIVQKAFVFATFFVLARLLVPADFGVVAIAAIVPSLIEGLTALAFDTAIVQKQGDVSYYLNAIWTFTVLRGLTIFLLVFFSAPFIAAFFHVEYALTLIRFAGATILLQSMVNIGQVYFFIDLDFKKVFIRDLTLNISYAVSAIILALAFHSYWAPFLGTMFAAAVVVVATYFLHPYRPRLDFKLGKLRNLLPLSQWLLGQELLNQLVRTLEDSLIGRFTSASDLGIYGKSKALANAPASPISSLINKVGFTSYARAQGNLRQVQEGVHKTFDLMLVIALPYYLAILIAGNRIVLLLLGPNWTVITPYLKFLVLAATIDMLFVSIVTPVFNAIGLPRVQFLLRSIAAVTILIGLVALVPSYGIWGASIATLAGITATACVTFYVMLTRLKVDLKRMTISVLVVAVSCALPLAAAAELLNISFFNTTPGYVSLIALTGGAYASLIVAIGIVTKSGPYPTLLLIFRSFLTTAIGSRIARQLGIHLPIR